MTYVGCTWQSPDAIRAWLSSDPTQQNPDAAALPGDLFGVPDTGREHGRLWSVLLESLVRFSPFCSGSWSLRLSFVTHLRYNEPDRLSPFPHRLLHAVSASGGWAMTFEELLDQAIAMLQRRGRLTYRTLKLQFHLDDEHLEALKDELIYGQRLAVDEEGRVLVWTGSRAAVPPPEAAPTQEQTRVPLAYTPKHLADKILTTRSALEGERKQVTVLFADVVSFTTLAEQLDPEIVHDLGVELLGEGGEASYVGE